MTTSDNLQVRLAARPEGMPTQEHWTISSTPVPELTDDGQVLVKVAYISVDPAMRGWIRQGASYVEPVAVGDVMRAGGAGTVVASNHEGFAAGDQVVGLTGVQSHVVIDGAGLTKVSGELAPLPTFLGVLGMPGLSAYFGLLDVGALAEGDTVLISGAAGAVGSAAGQIARIKGARRVVGIVGSDDKGQHLTTDLGFDGAINYRTEPVKDRIRDLCPEGVNVYFDNVGGPILDDALLCLARGARVVICGAISQYNDLDHPRGPQNYLSLLTHRARMEGFIIVDYQQRYPEAFMEMAGWFAAGKLHHRQTVVQGIETFPETFQRLFSGDKLGKLVIQV
ncbi:MAG: NADP-dependent oxidoreductase [Deltaproteobacteria bacterium]|jgi:NADPH-dependent curcumin reductase CurA|nr:NADP-dependent oxidoreductase [Deltaproteobacteria bacterium]MBW2530566.1 NADP-dependent oxidoreductase [Deltaproteobacteria bacterium]